MAYTDREDLNYLGQLYLIGANQTPFLNMIGGVSGGGKITKSFNFPVAQPWTLRAADQSTAVKSEATSITDTTETTYTRAQEYNTCQIMKYVYGVSFAKQSTTGEIAGLSIVGNQPVQDENAFQKTAALRQMAIDLDFSFLQGSYVANNLSSTVAKTRGIKNAITTNTVAAAGSYLSKSMIQELVREMAANGAQFQNMVLLCNAFNKQMISDIYGYAPDSRNVGGLNINQIITDFCMPGVVWEPHMPTDEIYIVDMSVINPVFCPYKGQVIADIEVPVTTAKEGGFFYAQVGLDYGPEEFHGSITGLKVD